MDDQAVSCGAKTVATLPRCQRTTVSGRTTITHDRQSHNLKSRYPDVAAQIALYRRMLDELHALPGAVSSGVTTTLPLSGNNLGLSFTIDGRPADPGRKLSAQYQIFCFDQSPRPDSKSQQAD